MVDVVGILTLTSSRDGVRNSYGVPRLYSTGVTVLTKKSKYPFYVRNLVIQILTKKYVVVD